MSLRSVKLKPPAQPITGEIMLPGSKSHTNRALIMAALAEGESELLNPSLSDDTLVLIEALAQIGVRVQKHSDRFKIFGTGGKLNPFSGKIHIGAAGTSARFLSALLCACGGIEAELCGSLRMHERPIGVLVDALRSAGAKIAYLAKQSCLPLRIIGQDGLAGGEIEIDSSISSQFISALLLIAPRYKTGLQLTLRGELVSPGYTDLTISNMQSFGVKAVRDGLLIRIAANSSYVPRTIAIEGDASGASYFWGCAALSGGAVRVRNLPKQSLQPDLEFLNVLELMGCVVEKGADFIGVRGPRRLKAFKADMLRIPDTAQTAAVLAACAEGVSEISGLSTLRNKETDRLQALHTELSKMAIASKISGDTLIIHGSTPKAATIAAYSDHRMAMAFAMLGALVEGMEIEDPDVVSKSYPDFWQHLAQLGVRRV